MSAFARNNCTRECAENNHCREGGIECRRCHGMFCHGEISEDGLCPDCADRAEAEREEEE